MSTQDLIIHCVINKQTKKLKSDMPLNFDHNQRHNNTKHNFITPLRIYMIITYCGGQSIAPLNSDTTESANSP